MSRIFITGDTHIPIDISKLNTRSFPIQNELTKDDYLIITGDFGLIWNYQNTDTSVPSCPEDTCWDSEEIFWYDWLNSKPFTTLFVDGNHENYKRLAKYPITDWNGGKVQKISDSIIHLMRGEIYTIDNTTLFALGGAKSHDRGEATGTAEYDIDKWWWKEEMPSLKERDNALKNLEKHGNKVDIVLTHDVPSSIMYTLAALAKRSFNEDMLNSFLQNIVDTVTFDKWYAGHYHVDTHIDNFIIQYQDISEYISH